MVAPCAPLLPCSPTPLTAVARALTLSCGCCPPILDQLIPLALGIQRGGLSPDPLGPPAPSRWCSPYQAPCGGLRSAAEAGEAVHQGQGGAIAQGLVHRVYLPAGPCRRSPSRPGTWLPCWPPCWLPCSASPKIILHAPHLPLPGLPNCTENSMSSHEHPGTSLKPPRPLSPSCTAHVPPITSSCLPNKSSICSLLSISMTASLIQVTKLATITTSPWSPGFSPAPQST